LLILFQGARPFDYKNVVVPAKEIIVAKFEKNQSISLEKLWEKMTENDKKVEATINQINEKVEEIKVNNEKMWMKISEKLDQLIR
jgi:hypothetical protein